MSTVHRSLSPFNSALRARINLPTFGIAETIPDMNHVPGPNGGANSTCRGFDGALFYPII